MVISEMRKFLVISTSLDIECRWEKCLGKEVDSLESVTLQSLEVVLEFEKNSGSRTVKTMYT